MGQSADKLSAEHSKGQLPAIHITPGHQRLRPTPGKRAVYLVNESIRSKARRLTRARRVLLRRLDAHRVSASRWSNLLTRQSPVVRTEQAQSNCRRTLNERRERRLRRGSLRIAPQWNDLARSENKLSAEHNKDYTAGLPAIHIGLAPHRQRLRPTPVSEAIMSINENEE